MKQNKVELLARPGVEEDKDDDEPVEPLLLHRFPDPETALLLVDPEVRVFLEPLGAFKPGGFLFLEQLCKAQKAERHRKMKQTQQSETMGVRFRRFLGTPG